MLKIPNGKNKKAEMQEFADQLIELSGQIGFKISARGWAYTLEGYNLITKAQFDIVENLINDCRRNGKLPIDFVAGEEARKFGGVEEPDLISPAMYMRRYLDAALEAENYYTPDWWDGEKYYIQMLVEKIDLKTLFSPICRLYHIPIATSKGWSSMLQRAEFANRFQEAEADGLACILLYCGDHDPDGIRISRNIKKNLNDLSNVRWEDGRAGYDPELLEIKRFGLNYDFIIANKLTWIDNLITARKGYYAEVVDGKIIQGKNRHGKPHPSFHLPYVQEYLAKYGVRKCEANALVTKPAEGRALCKQAIEEYLGPNSRSRFMEKMEAIRQILEDFRERTGLDISIRKAIEIIENEE